MTTDNENTNATKEYFSDPDNIGSNYPNNCRIESDFRGNKDNTPPHSLLYPFDE